MSIVEAAEKQEKLISRIKETIGTFQTKKLWNDDTFFDKVKDLLTGGELSEEKISKVVADALFNLKQSKPEVKHVKKLIAAFPDSLKCKNVVGEHESQLRGCFLTRVQPILEIENIYCINFNKTFEIIL